MRTFNVDIALKKRNSLKNIIIGRCKKNDTVNANNKILHSIERAKKIKIIIHTLRQIKYTLNSKKNMK